MISLSFSELLSQKNLPFKFWRDIIAGFMHVEKKKVTTWSK